MRGYIGASIGVDDFQAATAVLDSIEVGCPLLAHYASDIANSHAGLGDRVVTALGRVDGVGDRVQMNFVGSLLQKGDSAQAAELFLAMAQRSRAAESSINALTAAREDAALGIEEATRGFKSSVSSLESEIGSARSRLEGAQTNLELLQDEISEEAAVELAREYRLQADRDRRSANWAVVASGIMLVLAVTAGVTFVLADAATSGDFSTGEVVSHIVVSLTLLAIAGYCARLGGEYRQAMWHWRHTQLQLQRFFPFIGRLDGHDQSIVIAEMTPRFFPGQAENAVPRAGKADQDSAPVPNSDAATIKLLTQLLLDRSKH